MELVEVYAQRHRDHIGGVDAVELLPRELRRAHHGVVALGRPPIRDVGDRAGQLWWKYLPDKAIEPFMRNHHGGDIVASAPFAERAKGEPIRHLEGVRGKLCQQRGDGSGQHRTIAAGERDQLCGQGDSNDSRRHLAPFGVRTRYHQEDFVASRAVLRAQTIHCRTQAPRTRAVEICDLHYPHELNLSAPHVRSTT